MWSYNENQNLLFLHNTFYDVFPFGGDFFLFSKPAAGC